ncbi:MAG: NUDIX domain-containing protein [Spirochaetales bacterium]|nr:NUDIX domain-containing protein [Spirochaetales bacterium]
MSKEMLPLVNDKGERLGQASREQCHSDPSLLHPVVHLHVFNSNGLLFIQKRAKTKDTLPGLWDTSVGGHVSVDEDILLSLKREAQEELGVESDNAEFLYSYIWKNTYETELVYTYRLTHDGPIRISKEEIDEGRFFSREEILEKLNTQFFTPNFEYEVKQLLKKNLL